MLDISTVDGLITQQGQFCLLDWMLAQNGLPYSAYEEWRLGKRETLDQAFGYSEQELATLQQQLHRICRELKLQSDPQSFYPWAGETKTPLLISRDTHRHTAFAMRWSAPQGAPQMDLFMDNSLAISENQLQDHLSNRQFDQANETLSRLTRLNPNHGKLGGYQDLIYYGWHCRDTPTIHDDQRLLEFKGLLDEVVPLASELLGNKRRDFLAFAWRRMAENLKGLLFSEATPEFHRSYALLQIPDWPRLISALETDRQVLSSPILLARLGQGYWYAQQAGAFFILWGFLFERFPTIGEALMEQQAAGLKETWERFLATDEGWTAEIFLGYVLIQQPGLLQVLEHHEFLRPEMIQHPINRSVLELLRAKLAEQDERNYREALRELCPPMLQVYLNKRDWFSGINKHFR